MEDCAKDHFASSGERVAEGFCVHGIYFPRDFAAAFATAQLLATALFNCSVVTPEISLQWRTS
jgi:hypothetical protein